MKVIIYSFTDRGRALAKRLATFLSDLDNKIYENVLISEQTKLTQEIFDDYGMLIFVGAVGIATRLMAPYIKDKLTDPAAIVIDENGQFVIPILSGHVGGANKEAKVIAELLNATPVITTATDINNIIAVDEFAAANKLQIFNRDNIKKVSSGLLKGKKVNISFDDDVLVTSEREIDKEILGLLYSPIIIGLGMRRGKSFLELKEFVERELNELGIVSDEIMAIATIDIKKDEVGLIELANYYKLPLYFYSAEELSEVPGDFEESEFVETVTGVSDVSARAAVKLGQNGRFLLKKKKENGMTISIFKKFRRVTFEY